MGGGILVLQTAFLGDIVLTTPLLRELKRVHPRKILTVLTTPVGRDLLEGSPFVDSVFVFDKRGAHAGLRGTWAASRAVRDGAPSIAIAAQRSARTGFVAFRSGAPLRIGFSGAAGRLAYTRTAPWNADTHAVHRYLALAGPAGGDPRGADPRPELSVRDASRQAADVSLAEAGVDRTAPILAIAPGSIWGTKRWTVEGFAEVARAARERGLSTVLLGSRDEQALCEEVARFAGTGVVLAGRTSIGEMAAVLGRSAVLVANDSGPGHVASAVGTPVVTIFGPTVPAFGYAPFGEANRVVQLETLECRPCHRHGPAVCPLGHHRCMNDLGAASVLAAIDEVLAARAKAPRGA